jgi:hypothetical protein
MIAWWGPIVWEYYASTEANGMMVVDSPAWLAHKATVGKAVLGTVKNLRPGWRGAARRGDGRCLLRRRQTVRVPQ